MTTFEIPTVETENFRLRGPTDVRSGRLHCIWCVTTAQSGVGGPFTEAQSFQRLAALIGHWGLRGFWAVGWLRTRTPTNPLALLA